MREKKTTDGDLGGDKSIIERKLSCDSDRNVSNHAAQNKNPSHNKLLVTR